jgi:hypothetical protein
VKARTVTAGGGGGGGGGGGTGAGGGGGGGGEPPPPPPHEPKATARHDSAIRLFHDERIQNPPYLPKL